MWSWRSEGAGLKTEADLIVAEQLVILLAEGVFRLRQDLDEILLAEAVKRCNDGQTADQLGNDAEFQQIQRVLVTEDCVRNGSKPVVTRDPSKPRAPIKNAGVTL